MRFDATASTNQAVRRTPSGRLFALALVAIGVVLIGGSPLAEKRLRADWFWTDEQRTVAAERQDHFDKLYFAYIQEKQRRASLGQPLMAEPVALERARAKVKEAKKPLRAAQRRPREIANAVRWTGAILCLLGLVATHLTRQKPQNNRTES